MPSDSTANPSAPSTTSELLTAERVKELLGGAPKFEFRFTNKHGAIMVGIATGFPPGFIMSQRCITIWRIPT